MNRANVGMRGCGKTGYGRWCLARCLYRVIFDPTPNRNSFPRGLSTQAYVVSHEQIRGAILALGAEDERSGLTIDEVIIAPQTDLAEAFEITCQAIAEWFALYGYALNPETDHDGKRQCLGFLVDEVTAVIPRGQAMPPAFDFLARSGDLQRLHIIVTTHAPQDIASDMRGILSYLYLFRVSGYNERKAVRDWCGPELADAVGTLPNFHFYAVDFDAGAVVTYHDTPEQFNPDRARA